MLLPLEFLDGLPYMQEGQIIITLLESYHKEIFTEIEEIYGINQ